MENDCLELFQIALRQLDTATRTLGLMVALICTDFHVSALHSRGFHTHDHLDELLDVLDEFLRLEAELTDDRMNVSTLVVTELHLARFVLTNGLAPLQESPCLHEAMASNHVDQAHDPKVRQPSSCQEPQYTRRTPSNPLGSSWPRSSSPT